MLKEQYTASVTTDCLCDEGDRDVALEGCSGDCYYWQKEDVFELLGLWKVRNGLDEDTTILISGEQMGWTRASGIKLTNFLELDGALSLNGDFRIEWYLEETTLTARRWSHDEPTGTGLFTFTIIPQEAECDKCGELIDKDIHAEELGMCVECSNRYFDHEEEESE